MKKEVHLLLFRWIYSLLTIGILIFIFTNSMQGGIDSGMRSIAITEWLNRHLFLLDINYQFDEYTVRKLAHLSEFMLLGFFLTLTLRVYTRRIIPHISWPLFAGLFTAVCDETIQMFSDARGPSLRDVWIDFSGFLIGLCAAFCIMLFFRRLKNRRKARKQKHSA